MTCSLADATEVTLDDHPCGSTEGGSSLSSSPKKSDLENNGSENGDSCCGFVKGPWTREEDDMLVQMVQAYGTKRWSLVASNLKGRTGKQCRERWTNQLNPLINKRPWSTEEDEVRALHTSFSFGCASARRASDGVMAAQSERGPSSFIRSLLCRF